MQALTESKPEPKDGFCMTSSGAFRCSIPSRSVTSFLGRFTQIRDELAAVEEILDPYFMVRTTLNNFSKPWGSFVLGIVAREVMPTWERIWDDFV
jgi:hypothetical protein